jgi:alcohol dehydrogenase
MKAAIFKGKGNIVIEDRPKPTIKEPTDAVVRVVLTCVCGSDLWFYRGLTLHPEGSVGHEFIGVVDDVGSEVKTLHKGDFVIAPFAFSGGVCANCQAGFQTACTHGGFFGMGTKATAARPSLCGCPRLMGHWSSSPDLIFRTRPWLPC